MVQHGDFTVQGANGTSTAMTLQRGTVTAASGTSVTVKSTDGFTATYAVDSSTRGRTTNLAKGDNVLVIAQKARRQGGPDPRGRRPVRAVSGEQWSIRRGSATATVVELGGGLRTYTVDGVDIVAGYGPDEVARFGRGQQLMPWPNRIRDGRYSFAGKQYQLPLTEPALGNASHGLVRWLPWRLLSHDDSSLCVGATLFPQPGWDGLLELELTYALGDEGLTVTPVATNRGSATVPFGYGAHPYVALGETPLAARGSPCSGAAGDARGRPEAADRDCAGAPRARLPHAAGAGHGEPGHGIHAGGPGRCGPVGGHAQLTGGPARR